MKKSVYSVVLSDEVISEIDRLAYEKSTNRSNMINQILAEYVSFTTPEKRISDVFDGLAMRLFSGETFRRLYPPTTSVMSLRSALSYKYNPTVRYAVELYRDTSGCDGEIRVSMRTQNISLISEMSDFYILWTKTERKFGYTGDTRYGDGIFRRPINIRESPFYSGANTNDISVSDILAEYISLFDEMMKSYFRDSVSAEENIEKAYFDYLAENRKII